MVYCATKELWIFARGFYVVGCYIISTKLGSDFYPAGPTLEDNRYLNPYHAVATRSICTVVQYIVAIAVDSMRTCTWVHVPVESLPESTLV